MTKSDISNLARSLATQVEVETLLSSIGDGVITTDEFGKITRINPAAENILGWGRTDLVGKWFPRAIIAADRDGVPIELIDRPIVQAFLTGLPISNKHYLRSKHGALIPVAVTVSPIIHNSKPIGAVEVFRDISVEDEIDRMKSEFISLASHQLRTPLSAIKTYSHMISDGYMGEITPEQKRAIHTIIAATNRMNELISTLLNITRIEAGTIVVANKTVKPSKLGEEIIREVSMLAEDRAIKLLFTCACSRDRAFKTDPILLKEILANLVTNAIKYTPPNGTVELIIKSKPNCFQFIVKDSGWGIPSYEQEQIFSKFFRAKNIIKRETTGTGLGLYLVKGLVEALGGNIKFESEEGEGTSFFVEIPRDGKVLQKTF